MQASENAYKLIKKFEGLRLRSYKCPAGLWTIGWGHTRGVKPNMSITKFMAEVYLQQDVEKIESFLNELFPEENLTQNQFDALVSFHFNIGCDPHITLIRKLKAGDVDGAAAEFDRWVFSKKRRLPGLVKRRQAERALFESKT